MSQEQRASRIAVLLFTDVVDSVGMERRLGTHAFSRLLLQHHELFRETLETVGAGQIHQDTGDGFLAEFSTGADAVNAALLFQSRIKDHRWESEAPKIRVGLHQGQLAEIRLDPASPGKIFGIPVSTASRVMNLAQGGQILLTRPVYDDARQFIREHPAARLPGRSPPALKWKAHGAYLLQGGGEPTEVFEVGAAGSAPLSPPPDSEKARRAQPAAPEKPRLPRALIGAALTVLCGLALMVTDLGDSWANASYDYLYRFGAKAVTNDVVLVLMDKDASAEYHQVNGQPWDRQLHANLLNRLADDGCKLVVLDTIFREPGKPETDQALAEAMLRQGRVLLMADQAEGEQPGAASVRPLLPAGIFLAAARTNWGIGWLRPDLDLIVRRHWPFPSPGPSESLPWAAARLAGARLDDRAQERWLRYYGPYGAWTNLSFHRAFGRPANYFRDKIVFVGFKPWTPLPDGERDEFSTPYTRVWWESRESSGGVAIHATAFLNLMNGDWLRRPHWLVEAFLVVLIGALLGGGLCRFGHWPALGLAAGAALIFVIAGVSLSYFTNYWIPWLVFAGGQVPCALAWALAPTFARTRAAPESAPAGNTPLGTIPQPVPDVPVAAQPPGATMILAIPADPLPDTPDYELFQPPIGEGGYGRVWLARNAIGQWQALKAIYQAKFGDNPQPYEAEFKGLQKYKPISEMHAGLLRVDLVSRQKGAGYFYYVMELADALNPGWEGNPAAYKPRDLEHLRKLAEGRRLPVLECLRIGTVLAEALAFLHHQGLTHRDIKPSNVIFVHGRPKLADVGLVTHIRPADQINTLVGTPGYMPPPPERPGTAQADIYALGMLLYVISTGRDPAPLEVLSAALLVEMRNLGLAQLSPVILKACRPDCAQRYQSAAEMHKDLLAAQVALESNLPTGCA